VSLDVVLDLGAVVVLPQAQLAAPLGAHDPLGDRERELVTERVADRQHPFADAHCLRRTQRSGTQSVRLDLEHADIGVLVAADDLRLDDPAVEQAHRDLLGAIDHVMVGEDVAVTRHDEARTTRRLDTARVELARAEERYGPLENHGTRNTGVYPS